jgi:hypothetical protein
MLAAEKSLLPFVSVYPGRYPDILRRQPLQTISLAFLVFCNGRAVRHPIFSFHLKEKQPLPFPHCSNRLDKNSIRVIYLSITISQGRRRGRGYIGIIIGIRPVSQLYLCITPLELLGSNIYLIIFRDVGISERDTFAKFVFITSSNFNFVIFSQLCTNTFKKQRISSIYFHPIFKV